MKYVTIKFKIAYTEADERKYKILEFNGPPSGKGFKAFQDEANLAALDIMRGEGTEYLMGSWYGLPRKKKR